MKKSLLILIASLLLTNIAFAEDHGHGDSPDKDKHSFGIFTGYTHLDGSTDFSYGLEYMFEFDHNWAVNAIVEKTDGAHHNAGAKTRIANILYSPAENFWFGVGYGREEVLGDHGYTEHLYRVSAAYDIEFKHFKLVPTLAFEKIGDEMATVAGVTLSKSF